MLSEIKENIQIKNLEQQIFQKMFKYDYIRTENSLLKWILNFNTPRMKKIIIKY